MSPEPLDVLIGELRDPDEEDAAQYVIERDYGRAACRT